MVQVILRCETAGETQHLGNKSFAFGLFYLIKLLQMINEWAHALPIHILFNCYLVKHKSYICFSCLKPKMIIIIIIHKKEKKMSA